MIALLVGLGVAALAALLAWLHHRSVLARFDEMLDEFGGGSSSDGTVSDRLTRMRRLIVGERDRADDLDAGRAQLSSALDALPSGVVIGDRSGEVIITNAAGSRFVGARHGEALVEAAVRQLITEAQRGREVSRRLDLAGPTGRSFELSASPLDQDEAPSSVIAIIDDVTNRKRLEAVRRDFVSNISHELKTPIGAIAILADALDGADDSDTVRILCDRIGSEAIRLSNIIDDLLDLSSIEAGEGLNRDPVLVAHLVDEAVARALPAVQSRSIELSVDTPDPSLMIEGDDRQLVSAVHNLLANAVKYSEEGGLVSLRIVDGPRSIDIEIEDQGIGIPTKDHERIFERFYRVDRGRSRATGGTGLGLAIVRHVAVNHGGSIRLHSREGEGSTFTLSVPRPSAESGESHPSINSVTNVDDQEHGTS